MVTLKSTLSTFVEAFESKTRDNGETFLCIDDDAPAWCKVVVRECHGGMMPDDTRYNMIHSVACDLLDRCEDDTDADSLRDDAGEIADGLVDVYNSARVAWLASHIERAGYIDEAQREGLISPETVTMDRIGIGQCLEYQEIAYQLIECCERVTEDANDTEGEEG
jgi:hypothetical protein